MGKRQTYRVKNGKRFLWRGHWRNADDELQLLPVEAQMLLRQGKIELLKQSAKKEATNAAK